MVLARLGNMYAIQKKNSSPWEKGIRVRARIIEIATAMGNAMIITRNQTRKEFNNACGMRGSAQAPVQLLNPHSRGGMNTSLETSKLNQKRISIGRIK